MVVSAALAICFLQTAQAVKQGDLVGARRVIDELAAKDPASALAEKERTFIADLQGYIRTSSAMAPRKAAERWLALVDRGQALPRRPTYNGSPTPVGSMGAVFGVLPRPAVWPEIDKIVAKRPATLPNLTLHLLFTRLNGDEDGVLRVCREIAGLPPSGDQYQDERVKDLLPQIKEAVARRRLTPTQRVGELEKKFLGTAGGTDYSFLTEVLPRERAEQVLLTLFERASYHVSLPDHQTAEMATRVVLSNLSRIKRPPWEIVGGMEEAAILDKLISHYGRAALFEADDQARDAKNVYLGTLIDRGDVGQASDLIARYHLTPYLRFGSYTRTHRDFADRLFAGITELQRRQPILDLWYDYVLAARQSGRAREAAGRLAGLASDSAAKPDDRRTFLTHLVGLHAFLGDRESVRRDYEAFAKLPAPPVPSYPRLPGLPALEATAANGAAIDAGIARELSDKEWAPRNTSLIDRLVARGRSAEAEALVTQGIVGQVREGRETVEGNDYGYRFARLYYLANRPQDVISLLQAYPYWEAPDLSDLLTASALGEHPPLAFYAAWAFSRTGRKALAVETLERSLLQGDHSDDSYRQLNHLGGGELLDFYRGLCKVNDGEPQPLIWNGELLYRLGRRREAERSIREAISLDPNRVARTTKAHEILAQILKSKGDRRGAAACQMKVRAAQLANQGDSLTSVGFYPSKLEFYPQAIAAYRESIRFSSTDYKCEESLAECLDAIGRHAEALTHYSRAFELSTRGVGPLQDNNPFSSDMDPEVSKMGIRILERAAKIGRSASAAYLAGELEARSDHMKAALEDYRLSVRLDPRFLVAWRSLAMYGYDFLSPKEAEKANYALLSLQPTRGGPSGCRFDRIRDLRIAYARVARSVGGWPKLSESSLFPLHPTIKPAWPKSGLRWLDRTPGFGSPPGYFLSEAEDIKSIFHLYTGNWEDH
ncbi:MAG: hypothetical protein ACHQ50_00835 [Fimbriimonadales bacterium]